MSLVEALATIPERETGGRTAISRFEYQTHWGASRIVDLFLSERDFRVGFEFHDDIIEVGGSPKSEWVKFFQVKTKEKGNWSGKEIVRRKPGKSSILGKLLAGKVKFKHLCTGTHLVATGEFSFSDSAKDRVQFEELPEAERLGMIEALKTEIGDDDFREDCFVGLEFWKSNLPLKHYAEVLQAKIVKLVESRFPSLTYQPAAFMRMIVDQCRTKSTKQVTECESISEVFAAKFIARSDVEKWLRDLSLVEAQRPNLAMLLPSLPAPWYKPLKANWKGYELQRRNPANLQIERLRFHIGKVSESISFKNRRLSFVDMIDEILPIVLGRVDEEEIAVHEDMVLTSIVYESLVSESEDEQNRSVQEVNSKSANENS